ncbi:MAG: hypothetical protein AAFR11_06445 [Pseudomonadota bacterium]
MHDLWEINSDVTGQPFSQDAADSNGATYYVDTISAATPTAMEFAVEEHALGNFVVDLATALQTGLVADDDLPEPGGSYPPPGDHSELTPPEEDPEDSPYSVIYSSFNGENDDYDFLPDGDQSDALNDLADQQGGQSYDEAAENAGTDLVNIAETVLSNGLNEGVDIVRVGNNVYLASDILSALQLLTARSAEIDIGAEILNGNIEEAFEVALETALNQASVSPATSAELSDATIGVLVSDNVTNSSAFFAVAVPPSNTYQISGATVTWFIGALNSFAQTNGYSRVY